jgi:CRP-like cAMP-binding protein
MSTTLDLFRNETEFERFAAGQTIFTEGDRGETMYVVIDGKVELRVKGKLVESLGQGGVFGEMALIDHEPRAATAIAKSDCKLVAIAERRFLFMVQQTPRFALQIMNVIAERLRRMNDRL